MKMTDDLQPGSKQASPMGMACQRFSHFLADYFPGRNW